MQQPRFAAPWQVALSDDGLYLRTPQGETQYRWAAFSAHHLGAMVLRLDTGIDSFVPLPRRIVGPDDIRRIEAWLRAAGVSLGAR